MDALRLAAKAHGMELAEFYLRVERIVHGTTVSTNALVEGKTGRVGLLCNAGHPDVLTIREAPRKRAFTIHIDYPPPYIPRSRTCEVRGRIDALGNEREALVEQDVLDALDHFRKCNVEALAVCFFWSIVNPAHELQAADIIARAWPGVPVTLSHAINPIPREYRRTIATAINASLLPIMGSYIRKLTNVLAESGFRDELLIANCVGGMMPPDEIITRPIYSVMSGPTLAPMAGMHLSQAPDVIVVDMGGTTFDVSALRDRQLVITPEATFGTELLGIPKVDVRSVGAGGGSIAWVDNGGLLRVGPQSASSRPGPACYGLGGSQPTVTDANVVLGIIDPDYFLGGRIRLDRAKAEEVIGSIAHQLNSGQLETAYAIYAATNQNMIVAIEDITVNEGIDPRQSQVICGGGATGCHIGEMVQILGIQQFMVPKLAAGLSAYGGLLSDVRWEERATLHVTDRNFDFSRVSTLLLELKRRGQAFLDRAGFPSTQHRFEYSFQGRYLYQSWEIEVHFDFQGNELRPEDLPRLAQAFHQTHERIYTVKDENDSVEFVTWKVRAVGVNSNGARRERPLSPQMAAITPKSERPVYMGPLRGKLWLPVYDGRAVGARATIPGPCIIEEPTTTILLQPGQVASTDESGNYLVSVARG